MVEKLQREVNNSVNWLKDNRLCVAGDKSKILIVGTKQLKRKRLKNKLAIVVDQDIIEETTSEKLLGVVVNNNLTWKEHLYGDNENEGLITQLKKRVGTLKRLAKYMSKKRLSMLSGGIFYSKLVYCLAAFGNFSGVQNYREDARMAGITSDDWNKLQVIQKSLNRLKAGSMARSANHRTHGDDGHDAHLVSGT